MKFRKLRIAFSAACLIACVLLLVLWVRSYWWVEYITYVDSSDTTYIASFHGGRIVLSGGLVALHPGMSLVASRNSSGIKANSVLGYHRPVGYVPCWLATMTTWAMATLPWLRWRFTLRTLLIATTLVAVALGLIVWLR